MLETLAVEKEAGVPFGISDDKSQISDISDLKSAI